RAPAAPNPRFGRQCWATFLLHQPHSSRFRESENRRHSGSRAEAQLAGALKTLAPSPSPVCTENVVRFDVLIAAHHSITSSARASSVDGISRPIARAVGKLMTNSNLVDRIIGRSAGLAPLRILPV